ncbi:hypothetical protein D3C81_1400820 [compost metagenome]
MAEYTRSRPSIRPGRMSSISVMGKASSAPKSRIAPSWPARRPSQSSRSGLRSRQNSTYSPCSRPGIRAITASGSGKPLRYWKSLSWRYTCSTSRLRMATAAAGRMAMLLGSICAISALRRRAYSDLGMWLMGSGSPWLISAAKVWPQARPAALPAPCRAAAGRHAGIP